MGVYFLHLRMTCLHAALDPISKTRSHQAALAKLFSDCFVNENMTEILYYTCVKSELSTITNLLKVELLDLSDNVYKDRVSGNQFFYQHN